MTAPPSPHRSRRRIAVARLGSERYMRAARLLSGVIMMAFVTMHLINLALGLISLETAEMARRWFMLAWRNPVGTVLLYGAFIVHVALVLRSLFGRRTLVMPLREAAQIVLGLAIPLLIAEHVIGTRVFEAITDIDTNYRFVISALWVYAPEDGIKQVVALVVIWVHGCIGLHFWLRFRESYAALAPYLLVLAVLVPVLSLLAFADTGRELAAANRGLYPPGADPAVIRLGVAWKDYLVSAISMTFAALLAILLLLRLWLDRRERRDMVEVRYESGQVVRIPRGSSVLEASRIGGVPHYAVCGGKGRCSTCRVRIIEGAAAQPGAGPLEALTLTRIHAGPGVRLACQLRPTHALTVLPLLAADRDRLAPAGTRLLAPGREQEIAVLFCDIRSFTALADRRLPYDVVFLLNRYFAAVGTAVEQAGGRLDKFIGDGAMALFGLSGSKADACRQALEAAAAIVAALGELSEEIARDLPGPLRVAIGIHAGPAIVGAMGFGGVVGLTAIGDTVNIASRLESVAKELDATLVVSGEVARLSGVDLAQFETRRVEIRGSARPLDIRVIPQGAPFRAMPAETVA